MRRTGFGSPRVDPLTLDALFGIVQDATADAKARRKAAMKIAEYLLPKVPTKAKTLPDEYGFLVNPDLASEYRDIQLELRALMTGPTHKIPAIAEKIKKLEARSDAIRQRLQVPCPTKYPSMKQPMITSNCCNLPRFARAGPLLAKRRRPKKRIGGCASTCSRIVRSKSFAAARGAGGRGKAIPKEPGVWKFCRVARSRPRIKKSLSGCDGFTRSRAEASFVVAASLKGRKSPGGV